MSRKELHQEIEQLIQSIKLHYNQISHEVRIPSIELELITSKIRRLHEKSIIYNHLHHLEEQGLILTRSLQVQTFTDEDEEESENHLQVSETVTLSVPVNNHEAAAEVPVVSDVPPAEPTAAPKEAVTRDLPDLQAFVSINDKYMFISSLFWGNADEYRKAISELTLCTTLSAAEAKLGEFAVRFKWEKDSEVRKGLEKYVRNRYI